MMPEIQPNNAARPIFAVILAAGWGQRFQDSVDSGLKHSGLDKTYFGKQFQCVDAGGSILQYALSAFCDWGHAEAILVVLPESFSDTQITAQQSELAKMLDYPVDKLWVCRGGASRAESALLALQYLEKFPISATFHDWVLVHDAARPLIHPIDIARLVGQVGQDSDCVGGILAEKITATVKRVTLAEGSESNSLTITQTVCRDQLYAAQTPQLFRYQRLLSDLTQVLASALADQVTDEASAIELADQLLQRPKSVIKLVESRHSNPKLTVAADWPLIVSQLIARQSDKHLFKTPSSCCE